MVFFGREPSCYSYRRELDIADELTCEVILFHFSKGSYGIFGKNIAPSSDHIQYVFCLRNKVFPVIRSRSFDIGDYHFSVRRIQVGEEVELVSFYINHRSVGRIVVKDSYQRSFRIFQVFDKELVARGSICTEDNKISLIIGYKSIGIAIFFLRSSSENKYIFFLGST